MSELRQAANVIDVRAGELKTAQIFERLLKSGGYQELTVRRQIPDEEFEGRALPGLTGLPKTGRHRQFVKVGFKAAHVSLLFRSRGRRRDGLHISRGPL